MDKQKGKLKEYYCEWCKHRFEAYALKVMGEVNISKNKYGKKGTLYNQIRCPKCRNFIKTW
jgi:DNA-directed RNA polymerase subunit RPC12/RpoP